MPFLAPEGCRQKVRPAADTLARFEVAGKGAGIAGGFVIKLYGFGMVWAVYYFPLN